MHSDNAKRGLLLADDRILLYNNGGDYQENNTTIDPAAVAWTHIQYPALYITDHWPIRYASISSDGKYIAIAGKRGFAHYNAISNRWKLFGNQHQEQSFLVRGGMVWYKNIIIVACESLQYKTYEVMASMAIDREMGYSCVARLGSHVFSRQQPGQHVYPAHRSSVKYTSLHDSMRQLFARLHI